ncbi:hypothetical protein vseg_011169 [Gypsophila vaccaria]
MAEVAQNVVQNSENYNNKNSNSEEIREQKKEEFEKNMNELADLLSKLNPLAKEFIPSSYYSKNFNHINNFNNITDHNNNIINNNDNYALNLFSPPVKNSASHNDRRRRNGANQGRRRVNGRSFRAQREESVRRTVYVSDIDQHVTEERLASMFSHCGQVVDCRICGDPHSVLRFAFVEFADMYGAKAALSMGGTVLGYYPVKVLPSKTAILPVNPTFLPRSEDEREMCARTVYCTNIDKKVAQSDVKNFFESSCGEVSRLRILGDNVHSTRIAFVEFVMAESAIMALNCSGMILGTLPIRVSPSKTPVRPRLVRQGSN